MITTRHVKINQRIKILQGLQSKRIWGHQTQSILQSKRELDGHHINITYDIIYDIVYDIVCDIVYDIVYDIVCDIVYDVVYDIVCDIVYDMLLLPEGFYPGNDARQC